MSRYKKGTKKCNFCCKRKNSRYFGKGKEYCKSCWRLYFKPLSPQSENNERENLLKLASIFNHRYRLILQDLSKDKYIYKQFRKHLRNYGKKANQRQEIIYLLETYNC